MKTNLLSGLKKKADCCHFNSDFSTANGVLRLRYLCIDQNLQFLIHEPTRVTPTSSTVFDQTRTNAVNYVRNATVLALVSNCAMTGDLDQHHKRCCTH